MIEPAPMPEPKQEREPAPEPKAQDDHSAMQQLVRAANSPIKEVKSTYESAMEELRGKAAESLAAAQEATRRAQFYSAAFQDLKVATEAVDQACKRRSVCLEAVQFVLAGGEIPFPALAQADGEIPLPVG